MKKFLLGIIFLGAQGCENNWVIVGAGPAGIITTALLLDLGTPAKNICMIDPCHDVGDLSLYPHVSANTKTQLWREFLSSFKIIREINHPSIDKIFKEYDPEKEYNLSIIIEPLKLVSDYIRSKIAYIKDKVTGLYFHEHNWRVAFSNGELVASHVVLATGSHPKKLDLSFVEGIQEISLVDALDKERLAPLVHPEDVVAVVGSAHSAILILKHLSELPVKEVVNFYNQPLKYTEDMGGWYLNISSGLKGVTAHWAKTVLEVNPPANLKRIFSSQENLKKELSRCTKIIQAVGFERNQINLKDYPLIYNDVTGVIAPRLFGIGIAFPEKYVDKLGNVEHRVGINSFTEYALKVVPEWAKCKKNCDLIRSIAKFEELFEITVL